MSQETILIPINFSVAELVKLAIEATEENYGADAEIMSKIVSGLSSVSSTELANQVFIYTEEQEESASGSGSRSIDADFLINWGKVGEILIPRLARIE
jgi:hypothetical protein